MAEFVRLNPDSMVEIIGICQSLLDQLEDAKILASDLGVTRHFGDLSSAKQLAAGFARKGRGTPESAYERIDQYIRALSTLRDAFASGGEAFLEADLDWLGRIQAEGEGAPGSDGT